MHVSVQNRVPVIVSVAVVPVIVSVAVVPVIVSVAVVPVIVSITRRSVAAYVHTPSSPCMGLLCDVL